MTSISADSIRHFEVLIDRAEEPLKKTFVNMHQGYPARTLMRFLKARNGNVLKAYQMLVDSLKWRIQDDIDNILRKPITRESYREVRSSQLIGLSGYTKQGLPVFAIGIGLSTFDKASVHDYVQSHIQINEYRDRVLLPTATKKHGRHINTCVKILDMTGLKLSALCQLKLLTIIATIDDLNYPEKTETYYIVNAPYIFSTCWKVVKPLLQERTTKKVQMLQGSGKDELLKIMDYGSLPHFCRREGHSSSSYSNAGVNCFSLEHPFHQQMYNFMKQEYLRSNLTMPILQGSFRTNNQDATSIAPKTIQAVAQS